MIDRLKSDVANWIVCSEEEHPELGACGARKLIAKMAGATLYTWLPYTGFSDPHQPVETTIGWFIPYLSVRKPIVDEAGAALAKKQIAEVFALAFELSQYSPIDSIKLQRAIDSVRLRPTELTHQTIAAEP